MKTVRRVLVLVAAGAMLLSGAAARADELYWNETNFPAPHGRIVDTSGGGDALFPLDPGSLPEGIAYDGTSQKIYWVEAAYTVARILRANQNYTGVEVLVSGGSAYRGLALDVAGGKMYWTSSNQIEGGKIRRANLDGTNVEVLLNLAVGSNPRGIALDLVNGKMYWADLGLGRIQRANLDGTLSENIANFSEPWGVAIDPGTNSLYVTEYDQGQIVKQAAAPFARPVILKGGLANPTYLALDPTGQRLFWIEAGAGGQKLRESNTLLGGVIIGLPVAVSTYGGIAFSSASIVGVPSHPPSVTQVELGAVSPNPVVGRAQIAFALPQEAHVLLRVLDVRGREVGRLVDEVRPAGRYVASWDARTIGGAPLDSGVYFVRLVTRGVTLVRRTVLLRTH